MVATNKLNSLSKNSMTTPTTTSGQRQRPASACGKKFDYPAKGSAAPRHFE